jgi:predicted acyl esterase
MFGDVLRIGNRHRHLTRGKPRVVMNRRMDSTLINADVIFERDIAVPTRDGVVLSANLFRPVDDKPAPVIMSVTPYGKDSGRDRVITLLMRLTGVRFGNIKVSRFTSFEAPDPLYWVRNGFAVMQTDVRGMHKSQGHAGVLTDRDAEDYYDVIEWAAAQSWCDGGVGLSGVSYLAMSQWRVAALRPPHLKAIIPWEGVSDLYREFAFHGGIPETGFVPTWWNKRMRLGRNRQFDFAEDFLAEIDRHPLDDGYWRGKQTALERIEVPALVCASWSDQGLHTRGSCEAFARIGSPDKWLYTHGRKKWETYYQAEAVATQQRFLDHYLKGQDNGWRATPRVRIEVRKAYYRQEVRYQAAWPIAATSLVPLYLDADQGTLSVTPVAAESPITYDARRGRAAFSLHFTEAVELTGEAKLRLWVSTPDGDDLDLFVALKKFDQRGREVFFSGYNGYRKDGVAKGWLRASQRALDPSRSRPSRPYHSHDRREKLSPDQVVAVEIEILPSSTCFEAHSRLQLEILGRDAAKYPALRHRRLVNRGRHVIHCGGRFDSQLLMPLVRGRIKRLSGA